MNLRRSYREILNTGGGVIVPGVYDALSARIAAAQGFRAIGAGGYAAVGSMLGGPDVGQSNMRDYADHYARICAAVEIPVTVDADTGFGDVHNVQQTVRAFEAAGVAGLMLGDQVFPNRCGYLPGKTLVPVEDMLAKIRAAVDARRDPDLVIIARTDAAFDRGINEAIDRCNLFLEAGADLAKPQGVDRADEIRRAIAAVPCPFMATLSQAASERVLDVAELRRLGVATIGMPSIGLFAAARGVAEVLAELARGESLGAVEDRLITRDAYYDLVGLEARMRKEEEFRAAARSLMRAAGPRADA